MDMVDRISQLPDHLIHRILSLLPPKHAVAASTLSRLWNHLCSTSPTLDFHVSYKKYYANQETYDANLELFLNRADESLQRRFQNNLYPRKFRMHTSIRNGSKVFPTHMDRWVGIAIEKNVETIELEANHTLPPTLLSAKFLTVLKLSKCTLEGEFDIQLFHLRKLCLKDIWFSSEEIFQKLILGCPLIEALVLEKARRLKNFRLVPSLIQLKQVHLISCHLESIVVLAPNLHTFQLMKSHSPNIEIATVKNLKLHDCDRMTKEQFQNLMSKLLPKSLETLELDGCNTPCRIKISSQKLKGLILRCTYWTHVDIDTPNLLSLHLNSSKFPIISMNSLNLLKKVHIQFSLGGREIHQLAKLKDILVKSRHSKDFKFFVRYSPWHTMMIHETLSEVQLSLLYKPNDLSQNIFICITTMSYADLLNEMVCPWRPKTLSLVCSCNNSTEEFQLLKSMDGIGAEDSLLPEWKFFLESHSVGQYQTTTIWYYGRLKRNRSIRSRYVPSVWDDLISSK